MSWRLIAEWHGSAVKPYRIALQDSGEQRGQIGCTCWSWRRVRPHNSALARTCKHTRGLLTAMRGSTGGMITPPQLKLLSPSADVLALLRAYKLITPAPRAPGAAPELDIDTPVAAGALEALLRGFPVLDLEG